MATIKLDEGYSFVRREQLQRYAIIQMEMEGRDVDSFVKQAGTSINQQVRLLEGYVLEWVGAFENQQRPIDKLDLIVSSTFGLTFILLFKTFNSGTHNTII